VFFAPANDHICTRIEHVNHVESASFTIANFLGLNTELTKAISIGHDIGHAPFGHLGETIIKEISEKEIGLPFWHEKNGLHFVDDVEALIDSSNRYTNMNLTYAVRDGIISHCGEVNQNGIFPRDEAINLSEYKYANQYNPYTWEGCIVKCADKISYLGRDIEDTVKLHLISPMDTLPLLRHAKKTFRDLRAINTTSLMHLFIIDLCQNSTIENGLRFSEPAFALIKTVMAFNYEKIYQHPRLVVYKKFAQDIIETIYNLLLEGYNGLTTNSRLEKMNQTYPDVFSGFLEWIQPRWDLGGGEKRNRLRVVYNICFGESEYKKAVIDYISGMTDNYAKRIYDIICAFK
jgi:dGTP triphosphohydrolase